SSHCFRTDRLAKKVDLTIFQSVKIINQYLVCFRQIIPVRNRYSLTAKLCNEVHLSCFGLVHLIKGGL
ncbi:MAG: hypothetical protein V3V31_10065, partial [Methylococcales bacterium]